MPHTHPDRVKTWTRGFNGTLVGLLALTIGLNMPADPSDDVVASADRATLSETVAADARTLLPAAPMAHTRGVKVALATETRTDARTDLVDVTPPSAATEITDTRPDTLTPEMLDALQDRRAALDAMSGPIATAAPEPVQFRVTGSVVNLRAGPGTRYSIVTALERGAIVTATGATDGPWAQVSEAAGSTPLWMHSGYLAVLENG